MINHSTVFSIALPLHKADEGLSDQTLQIILNLNKGD